MNYQETLDFLYSQLPMFQRQGAAAYKANLNNTIALCDMLDNPQNDFPSIHIAGTNGKGSTSNIIASVFQQAGYKTGLYTSPHLVDFRERIRINGQKIPESNVVEFVERYSDSFVEIRPSFFEITFAMAIDFFRNEKVDIVIMETGMGGRLDSTNVVKSILSIITNIGLDHTAFLGSTLEEIAGEKAGIIKSKTPVIIGEHQQNISHVFIEKAKHNDSPILWSEDSIDVMPTDNNLMRIKYNSELWADLDFPLKGNYQNKNLRTAMAAILYFQEKWKLAKEDIIKGIENIITNTNFAGRWQIIQQEPKVIADTGHNTEGLKLTMTQLENTKYDNLHFVLGMVNDKEVDKVFGLLPKDAKYYFCKADIPRSLTVEKLVESAVKNGLAGNSYSSVEQAYVAALQSASTDDLVFVGGSTFIVAEVLEFIETK